MPADMDDAKKNEAAVGMKSEGSSTVHGDSLNFLGRGDCKTRPCNLEVASTSSSSKYYAATKSQLVWKELGQYIQQGYKLLVETCRVCGCIWMLEYAEQKYCISCRLDESKEDNKVTKIPREAQVLISRDAIPPQDSSPLRPPEIKPECPDVPPFPSSAASTSHRSMVKGVDVTLDLQYTVLALKEKLIRLSAQLADITNHDDLVDCLTSMSTTTSVLQKIKKL